MTRKQKPFYNNNKQRSKQYLTYMYTRSCIPKIENTGETKHNISENEPIDQEVRNPAYDQ